MKLNTIAYRDLLHQRRLSALYLYSYCFSHTHTHSLIRESMSANMREQSSGEECNLKVEWASGI